MGAIRVVLAAFLVSASASGSGSFAAGEEDAAAICREAEERYRRSTGGAARDGEPALVLMYKHTFCPRRLTVKRGERVRWLNVDRRTTHSVWFKDAGQPESDRKFPDEHVEMTVDLPAGEHRYLCGPHWERDGMVGTLVVE